MVIYALSTALLIHYEALKAKAMLHVFLTLFPIPSQAAGKIQAAALLLSASPPAILGPAEMSLASLTFPTLLAHHMHTRSCSSHNMLSAND